MNFLTKSRLALSIVSFVVIVVMANAYPASRSSAREDMTEPQDVRSLDRRISSLEQRLYSIETSISRLEQSAFSQRTPVLQPTARDPEISLLREEIQTLQRRLSEIECGLVKLDERTTTSAVREARRADGARTADPCRLNPATPLRLSTRP
jgi:predicted RNase H-like nuclease (RuvC/YqgF family)